MTQMTLTVAKLVGESFVFKESKSKSFKELIKSLTPACDSSESDGDLTKHFSL